MKSPLLIWSPAEVLALKATPDTPRPLPASRARDYVTEAREYRACERRALPSVDLVLGLLRYVEELETACDVRDELISWLTGPETPGQEQGQ